MTARRGVAVRMLSASRSAPPSSLLAEAPLDASEASRVHWAKRRGTAREPTRPQPNTDARPAASRVPEPPPEPPPEPEPRAAEEAVTKPEVDELLSAELVLGQGTSHTSGFGGSGKRRSSAREIALSLERFDKLFDKYEGFELHGEEGECDVYDLKDKIIAMVRMHSARTLPAHSARTLCSHSARTLPALGLYAAFFMSQVMDVKRKAALTTSSLHDAHSELENIARQADEEDLSAPDEVAALSMLIDELLSVSAGQKQKLKEKHKLSIEMMRDFVSTQLAGCMEDKARLAELEGSKSLLEKKAERDAVELEERAEREKKLQDEVFRLGEVASRQAEALEAKNAELLPLREAKAGLDAAVQAAVQEREARIAQLNHEVKTLREASEAAGGDAAQTIADLEQQVAALQAELTEAAEAASNANALVQVDHAALTSELSAAERAADSLGKQLKAADREAGAGATAKARHAAALVGLAALGSGLKQADVELSQAGKAVEAARADEMRAVSRAEVATQAMEQATQTLALTQAQLDSAAVESESLRAEAQTLQAKLDEASQQGVPGPAAAPTEPAAASAEATQRHQQ